MIRIVTFGSDGPLDQPFFWMLCENRSCGSSASMPADLSTDESKNVSFNGFMQKCTLEGWRVDWTGQVCVSCTARLEKARVDGERGRAAEAERNKKLVQIATPGELNQVGRLGKLAKV